MFNKSIFRLIKLTDIGLLGVYYLFGALIFISIFNSLSKKIFDKKDKPVESISTPKLLFQVCLQAALICIMGFFLRHFIRQIPYPFDGFYGYDHSRTKEVNGGVVIAFGMITAFSDFKDRTVELSKRIEYNL